MRRLMMICCYQERNMTDNLVAAMKPEIRFLNKHSQRRIFK
jgi:hypothetical protein